MEAQHTDYDQRKRTIRYDKARDRAVRAEVDGFDPGLIDGPGREVRLSDVTQVGSKILIGGGLGISYKLDDKPPHPSMYADIVMKEFSGKPYKLVLEPGRSLMGNSGMLVTKVLYLKEGTAKKFVIVDAAMNDLIRPAFYESYHEILPISRGPQDKDVVDVVGPICESGDFLAQDRELPKVSSGDLLAVLSAGAYGFVMSSNYNTRPRVAEVMVKGDQFSVIRERETYDDLLKLEQIPDFLL